VPKSHEIRVEFKANRNSDIDLTNVRYGHCHRIYPCYDSRGGGDVPFALITGISKTKYLCTKLI